MGELAQVLSAPFLDKNQDYFIDLPSLSSEGDTNLVFPSSPSGASSNSDEPEEGDFSDASLTFINQMLMEEDDLENKPCMLQQCLALQATEKSFYDALGKDYHPPPPPPTSNQNPDGNHSPNASSESSDSIGYVENLVDQFNGLVNQEKDDQDFYTDYTLESILQSMIPSDGSGDWSVESNSISPSQVLESSNGSRGQEEENNKRENSPNRSREKKTHDREDEGDSKDSGRGNKQLASSAEESNDQLDMYDKVLLCPCLNPHLHQDSSLCPVNGHDVSLTGVGMKLQQNQDEPAKGSNVGGRGRVKKDGNKKEVVDLRTLLSQCAQAVSNTDIRNAYDLLNQIKQHSSPYGEGIERLAHYFANALEARLAGTGTALYAASTKRNSAADTLRGYEVLVRACPFNWMSNGYANRSIAKLVQHSQRLHIIDFGILYGFQWPCLIQNLSMRPGGPPRVRITGIDFPQPGFRPCKRIEESGRRLATYCQRFGVPFEFHAIAKKWDTINLDDFKIESDEVLVVNCLHRLRHVSDDMEAVNCDSCPRDTVLNLMRRLNPDMFIHGIINGAFNAPFFVTRFREAVFYFSALFDMVDTTVPCEDEGRQLFEKEVWGRDIMNVIACEGTERVERPETYKQWQVRNVRAGFRQLPLNHDFLRDMKRIVKIHYNKNFSVDEDGKWMLQGWKGRVMFALSCWKPSKES